MADYDWDFSDGRPAAKWECCGAVKAWVRPNLSHRVSCQEHPDFGMWQQGFRRVPESELWKCERGCGGVVWDTVAHTVDSCRYWSGRG